MSNQEGDESKSMNREVVNSLNCKLESNETAETSGDEKVDQNENCDDSDTIGDDSNQQTLTKNQAGRKSFTGQTCTLKTLIDDDVIDPGNNVLSFDYMDNKFYANLLRNGTIQWNQTKQIFSTPSAWVNHCKKIINPENSGKTIPAWSTIRYKGKRLDSYKLRWYRRQKKISNFGILFEAGLNYNKTELNSSDSKNQEIVVPMPFSVEEFENGKEKNVIEHHTLGSRLSSDSHLVNVMVKCTPFSMLDRIQPFTLTISTNALLLIDFHSHLTTGEVVGYLGGTWDISSHNLSILQAFPCKSRLGDKERALLTEQEIRSNLENRHLSLVGWYHSHPTCVPQPTIKDIENQMEYQIAMKGDNDSSYTPCVGLISSPYDEDNEKLVSRYQAFWVMPPSEFKPHEHGKPMQMVYNLVRDSFLTQDLLLEMRLLAHFYINGPDAVKFKNQFKSNGSTYWDKLRSSLLPNLPCDLQVVEGQTSAQVQVQQQALSHFWAFLKGLILLS